jgi:hypothetical protein
MGQTVLGMRCEAFTAVFPPKLADHHKLKIAPFILQGRGYFRIDFWRLAEAPVVGPV